MDYMQLQSSIFKVEVLFNIIVILYSFRTITLVFFFE